MSNAQLNFFAKVSESLDLPDADVTLYKNFFEFGEGKETFEILTREIEWRQDWMIFYGRKVKLPRETAWYGDEGKSYTFSGIRLHPNPWTGTLRKIKDRIEAVADVEFNSVLLNRYRDGNDSVSWHSDAEPELGSNPVIGSVSFGETRSFVMKHKNTGEMRKIELEHGSFLLMSGTTQHFWVHRVPKVTANRAKQTGARINLTFRRIYEDQKASKSWNCR